MTEVAYLTPDVGKIPFFQPTDAGTFKRDIPDADVRFVDTDHFALETHGEEIAAPIRGAGR